MGPFAKYLQECGIIVQYTMHDSPKQNGVSERCNLPNFLWGEAIKTATYILNHVSSKFISKMPFKLWIGRKPSLNHFRV